MTPRTLRCANHHFYLGVVILVLGACVYALLREGHPAWQYAAAAAGIVVTLLWGGSYLILRYTVDDAGITRRTLFGTRRIAWADIATARMERRETAPGIESKAVTLVSPALTLRLTSELLDPDDIDFIAGEITRRQIPVETEFCQR